jgi:catechol 2,3-dioxygenase-like lactoylglutathione lyase family enzyme
MATSRDYGTPATGSPLYAATIGVEDLARSLALYGDAMGLDVLERRAVADPAFAAHWRMPCDACAEVAVLADRRAEAGRIVLVQFDAPGRRLVRDIEGQCFFGFVNLNFYVDDIEAQTSRLEALGCKAWSRPLVHDMGPAIGQPIEVMLDGPDGVIINLIQLRATNPEARILRTVAYIEDSGGFNRRGTTPVVTSAHNVSDYERARAFYERVLGMSVRNDTVLHGEAMERFIRFPAGARLRDTYLQGNHVFGKVALTQPLNFACTDLVSRAVAPNIGYLAQSFRVPNLAAALATARELGSEVYSESVEMQMPALGRVRTALVRNPGSGALHELIEPLP